MVPVTQAGGIGVGTSGGAGEGDCVLLAGKGHERSIVVGDDELAWDEEAVARAALAELGFAAEEAP